jgi:hypothetical protein
MNKRKTIKLLPKEFIGNSPEDIISDPHTIANKFNDYFVNVGPGIARKLPSSERSFKDYLSNNNKESFFLEPTTKHELEIDIRNLNVKKSPGYDGISYKSSRKLLTKSLNLFHTYST